ncbi:MAG: methyltransferase [Pseudonocardiaceae bacterium]
MATTAGDFFVDPLTVADAYLLMEVLHDWTSWRSCTTGPTRTVLRSCVRYAESRTTARGY